MKKILLLITTLVFILTVTSCGDNKNDSEICEKQANEFVSYFRDNDFEAMYEMTKHKDPYLAGTYDKNSAIGRKLFGAMGSHLTFEITQTTVNGNEASVKAHITTIDFKQLLTDVVSQYTQYCIDNGSSLSSDELGEALEGILEEALQNPVPFEKDTSIDFVKEGGKWIIDDNVGIYDDLSGGYITYCFGLNAAGGIAGSK